MANPTITVRYGSGNQIVTNRFPTGTSVGFVVGNGGICAGLGYGQNVEGYVYGVPNAVAAIADGMTIDVHDKACSKQNAS